eukprot:scaffold267_cov489-Pavlova_lutheri.AAC.3
MTPLSDVSFRMWSKSLLDRNLFGFFSRLVSTCRIPRFVYGGLPGSYDVGLLLKKNNLCFGCKAILPLRNLICFQDGDLDSFYLVTIYRVKRFNHLRVPSLHHKPIKAEDSLRKLRRALLKE